MKYSKIWYCNELNIEFFAVDRFPEDTNTYVIDDQFLWGSALMITPVLTKVRLNQSAENTNCTLIQRVEKYLSATKY